PGNLSADRHESALLQQAQIQALFHHPSGFFARGETQWYRQHNSGYATSLAGDDFFQHNIYLGYRFLHRRGEIVFGVLNLTAQDYRLNPLNPYFELPRDRVFYTRLRLDF